MPDPQEPLHHKLAEAESELRQLDEMKAGSIELVVAIDKVAALCRLNDRLPDAMNLELRAARMREKSAGNELLPPASMSSYGMATEFGGMTLLEPLGDGATAVVFRAVINATQEIVAVKVFKQTTGSGAAGAISDQIKRFEKESTTLRKLDCPNIVSVSGFGITPEGAPYIVMQYAEGRSIKSIIDAGEVFDADRTITLSREICRALIAAHAQDIIHRDLKPSNIIVNDRNVTKVVDFGIAKAMGVGIIDDTITQLGAILGSPAYMSPEQCLGEPIDVRTDVYSLGCTMFEMLTGIKAFASETTVQAIAKQINSDRSAIRKLLHSTQVTPDLEAVIMRCLDRNPDNRYRTIGELDHDLSALQLNKPIQVRKSNNTVARSNSSNHVALVFAAVSALTLTAFVLQNYFTPQPSHVYNSVARHYSAPVLGCKIVNRFSNKVIYDDPKAHSFKEGLQDAIAKKINLHEANLQNADLVFATISGADLSSADLTGARLSQAILTDVNLEGAILTDAQLTAAHLVRVNLSRAKLDSVNMMSCSATACNFTGADFSYARMNSAHLPEAICANAIFKSAELVATNFSNANLKNANFDGARLLSTKFSMADLSGARFTNCFRVTAHIEGANLANALMPDLEIDSRGLYLRSLRHHAHSSAFPPVPPSPPAPTPFIVPRFIPGGIDGAPGFPGSSGSNGYAGAAGNPGAAGSPGSAGYLGGTGFSGGTSSPGFHGGAASVHVYGSPGTSTSGAGMRQNQ